MQRRRLRWAERLIPGTAALALGLLPAPPAGAQAPVPVGGEFQVNTFTAFGQAVPAIAADADGDFVVVWESVGSSGTDTSSYSVQGQRYASDGSTQGAQFQVNTFTTNVQHRASVAAADNGDFTVVWHSVGSFGTDPTGLSIQGQRYASDGATQSGQFQVNSYATGAQQDPFVAADAEGDFVVVWVSWGSSGSDTSYASIQGQRYASNGSTQGGQFEVNTYTTSSQLTPSIAVAPGGDFVVVWQSARGSSGTDTSYDSIQGQRYASDGSTQGGEFQVNGYTTGYQVAPAISADADGDFVVVWESSGSYGTDTFGTSTQGQRYTSDGSTQGIQFQVNSYTTGFQGKPRVTANADGNFVVVWDSTGSDGTDTDPLTTDTYSVQGQRYASDGSTQGAQFQVNTYTTSNQQFASVAAGADDDFVVTWHSNGSSGTDTSDYSIQGQRYSGPAAAVPSLSAPAAFALAAALALLGATYSLRRRPRL